MTPDERGSTDEPAQGSISQLESELGVLFRRARQAFQATAVDVHRELNVTSYATLVKIIEDGPLRASALVDHFGTDKGSMSRQLTQLERLGLVRRDPDADDGRAQAVTATAVGKQRCSAARQRSRERLRRRMDGWPDGQVDSFASLLHDFNSALALHIEDPRT